MKKEHILPNGTKLEVGKKYTHKSWDDSEFIEILCLGDESFFIKYKDGPEGLKLYNNWPDLIPYQEPKKKDLEGLMTRNWNDKQIKFAGKVGESAGFLGLSNKEVNQVLAEIISHNLKTE